ncbi:MAG: hypothetical protein AB1782_16610 [Cyanobacteriota bacterium]
MVNQEHYINSKNTLEYVSYPLTIGNIVSKAWRIYRVQLKRYLIYFLIPAILSFCCYRFNEIIIALKGFNNAHNILLDNISCFYLFLVVFLFFVSCYFFVAYIKDFYYNLTGFSIEPSQIIIQQRQSILRVLFLSFIVLSRTIIFFFISMFLLGILFTLLSILFFDTNPAMIIILLAILIILLLVFTRSIVISFFSIPMQVVIFSIDKYNLLKTDTLAMKLLKTDSKKTSLLGLLLLFLFFTFFILSGIYTSLIHIMFNPLEETHSTYLLFFIALFILDICNYLIIFPLIITSTILYYFDIKSNKEGTDLLYSLLLEKNHFENSN